MLRRGPLLLLALATLLAGCIAAPAPEPAPLQPQAEPPPAAPALSLLGTGCLEGGGHSAHPKFPDYLPAPWMPADVQDDVGPVTLTSEWWSHPDRALGQANDTMGNYHATVVCDAWTLDGAALEDHVFGFVGMKVEPPPFDTAGVPADRHYLVTVLGTSDEGLQGFLHDRGFHATGTTGVAEIANGVFHNLLDTEDHGVYESYFTPVAMGEPPARVRLWWQLENEDGTFSPISLDMTNAGGTHLRGEGALGWFSHLRTADHAPLPGAVGEIYGLAYQGVDRAIALGPAYPDVRLEEAYVHQ